MKNVRILKGDDMFVLIEKDSENGRESVIASGDEYREYNNSYIFHDKRSGLSTICIKADGESAYVINGVTELVVNNEIILYTIDGTTFAYVFSRNEILSLGKYVNNCKLENRFWVGRLYINEQIHQATLIKNDATLEHFKFISYENRKNAVFFEIVKNQYRIFEIVLGAAREQTEEYYSGEAPFESCYNFYWRKNSLYTLILNRSVVRAFNNAFVEHNNDVYRLYGFNNGTMCLLGEGKEFSCSLCSESGIKLDTTEWRLEPSCLNQLNYTPIKDKDSVWLLKLYKE